MSKLTERSPEEIKAAKRVYLMLVEQDLVAVQGARIIGKVSWTPREKKVEAV